MSGIPSSSREEKINNFQGKVGRGHRTNSYQFIANRLTRAIRDGVGRAAGGEHAGADRRF